MIKLPCSTNEVFLCLTDSRIPGQEGSLQEVVIAASPEDAQRQVETFWIANCTLILSQTDVLNLMVYLKNMPIDNAEFGEVDPPYLVEKNESATGESAVIQSYLVSGYSPAGENLVAVVTAKTLPGAYFAASIAKPDLIPNSAFSMSQLQELNGMLEDVRNGRIPVAHAYPVGEDSDLFWDMESPDATAPVKEPINKKL